MKSASVAVLGMMLWAGAAAAQEKARPEVEVVFVLDTTSSMGGMIEGAKRKIWSIANEIAKGKPGPRVKMGLVAFRDKGDEYVTKVFDLSSNLDQTYKDLLSLSANGGGDGPEHVIAALADAVDKISWSNNPKAFKVVYLVGDAAPHEDYRDSETLEAVLQRAVKKGLLVNGLQCGTESQTTASWQKIARLGEGRFLALPQDGGAVAVATPFDEKMALLSGKLEGTMLAYGRRKDEGMRAMGLSAMVARAAAAPAAADRAEYKARSGFSGELDLAKAVEERSVRLEDVKETELPQALRDLPAAQRQAKVQETLKERQKLKSELDSLATQRAAYLKKAVAPKADAFDVTLVESLKSQASRKGIVY